jgi:hypothetical protein
MSVPPEDMANPDLERNEASPDEDLRPGELVLFAFALLATRPERAA